MTAVSLSWLLFDLLEPWNPGYNSSGQMFTNGTGNVSLNLTGVTKINDIMWGENRLDLPVMKNNVYTF
jgi:hypothetical protein